MLAVKVSVSSRLALGRDELWACLGTLEAVNSEMRPWLELRADGVAELDGVRADEPQRCSLRGPLGLPLGPYPLCFARAPTVAGFLERTTTPLLAPWQHERTLTPDGPDATVLTDALGWRLRGVGSRPRADAAVAAVVQAFFEHRHRRLPAARCNVHRDAPRSGRATRRPRGRRAPPRRR